ncbi:MAG: glycosyltransferase involved in cell wall biosynthesis [Verrucomicrobiales bacterium]
MNVDAANCAVELDLELSVVLPAYNEEKLLPATLKSVFAALEACGLTMTTEVIVVDNNSNDRTAEIARQRGAQVVHEPKNQISRARNAGGNAARGKYLLFLDADTELTAKLLQRAMTNLRNGDCCGGGVLLRMDREVSSGMKWAISLWNGIALKLGLAAGCFIYCLREGFEATGGFSHAVYAGEEIWFSRALKRWGRKRSLKFKVISDIIISTSSRKLEWFSSSQLLLQTLVLVLFPWAAYSRRLCRIWYHRPEG